MVGINCVHIGFLFNAGRCEGDQRCIDMEIYRQTKSMCKCDVVGKKPHFPPCHFTSIWYSAETICCACDTLRANMERVHVENPQKLWWTKEEGKKTMHKYNGWCWPNYKFTIIPHCVCVCLLLHFPHKLICNIVLSSISFQWMYRMRRNDKKNERKMRSEFDVDLIARGPTHLFSN